jgi:hypothetical protein
VPSLTDLKLLLLPPGPRLLLVVAFSHRGQVQTCRDKRHGNGHTHEA